MARKHYTLEYREQIVALVKSGRSIVAMCRLLRVSHGGYYAWRDRLPSQRSIADQALLVQIKAIHAVSREVYGAPRIHATLRERGIRISRRRVARLMLQQGLRGVCRRRRRGKPKRTGTDVLAPDQVRRSFQAERPNQLWVADATYTYRHRKEPCI